jgi:hypothetical protein
LRLHIHRTFDEEPVDLNEKAVGFVSSVAAIYNEILADGRPVSDRGGNQRSLGGVAPPGNAS